MIDDEYDDVDDESDDVHDEGNSGDATGWKVLVLP